MIRYPLFLFSRLNRSLRSFAPPLFEVFPIAHPTRMFDRKFPPLSYISMINCPSFRLTLFTKNLNLSSAFFLLPCYLTSFSGVFPPSQSGPSDRPPFLSSLFRPAAPLVLFFIPFPRPNRPLLSARSIGQKKCSNLLFLYFCKPPPFCYMVEQFLQPFYTQSRPHPHLFFPPFSTLSKLDFSRKSHIICGLFPLPMIS